MNSYFVAALDLQEHSLKRANKKIQLKYITALSYIIEESIKKACGNQNRVEQYIAKRFDLYRNKVFSDAIATNADEKYRIKCISMFSKPWRNKYRHMMICDMALILLDDKLILQAIEIVKKQFPLKRQLEVEQIYSLLKNQKGIEKKFLPTLSLINQYRANMDFLYKEERRIIITANMSAGKSTLINALIGKPIVRTSQEVCTRDICYVFNKAYEDNNIHLLAKKLSLCAAADNLYDNDRDGCISIASYFVGVVPDVPRLCIIDTPGVDAALYEEHSHRTYKALLSDDYDTIIYVASPTRLGTDAEKKHLQWVFQNLQGKKVIFVLNKLDDCHYPSDSIEESVKNFKEDLLKIGFIEPVVCPISAYFSYLIKLRMTGQVLSEDEADEYALYTKKFMKPSYDLSCYYEGINSLPTDSEEIKLSKRAGLYGLEKTIYGGGL